MSRDSSKPAIPVRQRDHRLARHEASSKLKPAPVPEGGDDPARPEDPEREAAEEDVFTDVSAQSVSSQFEQVEAMLQDPGVNEASVGKKRVFLKSKDIPRATIHQALETTAPTIDAGEFSKFRSRQRQARAPNTSAPPIITYPEFLVAAHQPPPLITPGRVVDAAYAAGAPAALLYRASTYLIAPSAQTLSDTRHELAAHSQGKLDGFNARLARLVSRVPGGGGGIPQTESGYEPEADDGDSVTSDPTELFHRDIGTQTSPAPSRRSSSTSSSIAALAASGINREAASLATLQKHLADLADRLDGPRAGQQECQDGLRALQHYLNTLSYTSPAIHRWTVGGWEEEHEAGPAKTEVLATPDNAIEALKKTIRNVKGVLLSARRFPSAAAAASAAVGRGGAPSVAA